MRRALAITAAALAALAPSIADTATARPQESAATTLRLPFRAGQAWYVCQGYNGSISHRGQPVLDLTVNAGGVGRSGCTGSANASANQPVYAPVSGRLSQVSSAFGGVCITFGSRSIYLGHLVSRRGNGTVSAGTQIGKVAPAGQANNGGYAHLHLQAHAGAGCGGARKVPFTSANGTRFANAPDLTYSGAVNQWRGRRLVR